MQAEYLTLNKLKPQDIPLGNILPCGSPQRLLKRDSFDDISGIAKRSPNGQNIDLTSSSVILIPLNNVMGYQQKHFPEKRMPSYRELGPGTEEMYVAAEGSRRLALLLIMLAGNEDITAALDNSIHISPYQLPLKGTYDPEQVIKQEPFHRNLISKLPGRLQSCYAEGNRSLEAFALSAWQLHGAKMLQRPPYEP